jgi:DNA-binding YbaB/EbfC family protein
MFGDLMNKMKDAQVQMEALKARLDHVLVDASVESGAVKVVATANKAIREISIAESLIAQGDKEALEELVLLAVNKALEKAQSVNDSEMQQLSGQYLSGLGL